MLAKLIEYDAWANRLIFSEFTKLLQAEDQQEAEKLFSHLLAAQVVWVDRMNGRQPSVAIWPDWTSDRMKDHLELNPEKLREMIGKKDQSFTYENSAGKKFTNTIEDILHHLIIHGQHHRAQIAVLLRKSGLKPPATDLIFYLRDG
jgi:uncharacterized damage-inducible protein DinB